MPRWGGQLSDTGILEFQDQIYKVKDVINQSGVYYHWLDKPFAGAVKSEVTLHVDQPRRHKIEAHHSGTHVLNWALRKVLGNTIGQKGSYVGPDRLRFDFNHGSALTPEELAEVERLVNEKINADVPVTWEERPYAEVKGDSSILQAFGDKYGEVVRVVSIGDFSRGTLRRHPRPQIGRNRLLQDHLRRRHCGWAFVASRPPAVPRLIEHVREHLPKQDEHHSTPASAQTRSRAA